MVSLINTLTELSWEFCKVGAQLVHHTPTNLFISTEGGHSSILDALDDKYDGVSTQLDTFRKSHSAALYAPLHTEENKANFIRVKPSEALLSVFDPVSLIICGGCNGFCCEVLEESSTDMAAHQLDGSCKGSSVEKLPGLRIEGEDSLFVVLDWEAKGSNSQVGEEEEEEETEQAPVPPPATSSTIASNFDADETLVDPVPNADFQEVGKGLYFHKPTGLFVKEYATGNAIFDPNRTKKANFKRLLYEDCDLLLDKDSWSSFYRDTWDPETKNFVFMDPDYSLLTRVPVWPLALCIGCYRFCFSSHGGIEGRVFQGHAKVCAGHGTAFKTCYGVMAFSSTGEKTYILFEKVKMEQLDGLIPGIMDDFVYETVTATSKSKATNNPRKRGNPCWINGKKKTNGERVAA